MVRAAIIFIAFAAVALAHKPEEPTETPYTGPTFDPKNALTYGPGTVNWDTVPSFPADTPPPLPKTTPSSSPASSPSSPSRTPVSSPTTTTSTLVTSTANTPPPTSTIPEASGTGAAQANHPEYVAAVAGGLLAGLALF